MTDCKAITHFLRYCKFLHVAFTTTYYATFFIVVTVKYERKQFYILKKDTAHIVSLFVPSVDRLSMQ